MKKYIEVGVFFVLPMSCLIYGVLWVVCAIFGLPLR